MNDYSMQSSILYLNGRPEAVQINKAQFYGCNIWINAAKILLQMQKRRGANQY